MRIDQARTHIDSIRFDRMRLGLQTSYVGHFIFLHLGGQLREGRVGTRTKTLGTSSRMADEVRGLLHFTVAMRITCDDVAYTENIS